MKRPLVVLTLAAALLVPATRASAQLTNDYSPFCIGTPGASNVGFCADAMLTVDGQSVTLSIQNASGLYGYSPAAILTNVGLDNILGGLTADLNSFHSTLAGWSLVNGSGNGTTAHLSLVFDAVTDHGVNGGITNGVTNVFTFNLTSGTFDPNTADLYVKAQGMQNSIECLTNSTANGVAACVPVTSTPEPASLALLGTGLVGIYGAVRRRRHQA